MWDHVMASPLIGNACKTEVVAPSNEFHALKDHLESTNGFKSIQSTQYRTVLHSTKLIPKANVQLEVEPPLLPPWNFSTGLGLHCPRALG
eukprot:jgi/Botrbrau1/23395/Bobra.0051s0041.1